MANQVPWLDDDEQAAWRAYLAGSVRLAEHLDAELKSAFGLSIADYEILAFLSEAPEHRLRMSDLAEQVIVSPSRLTYRVDKLQDDGLVDRQPCPTDGRATWAQLTPAGRALLRKAAAVHVTTVRRRFLDHFDRNTFLALGRGFDAVADALSAKE
jgi:DNA-binding MarR family transcriptional regulator